MYIIRFSPHYLPSSLSSELISGSAFIKPDQLDPWIKDQIKITLLPTNSHLLLHDTKYGNCRCKIVDSRAFPSWSLIRGLRWSGLIKAEPGDFFVGTKLRHTKSPHTIWGSVWKLFGSQHIHFPMICIQEKWITDESKFPLLSLEGYDCYHVKPTASRHDGLITYVDNSFEVTVITKIDFSTVWEGLFMESKHGYLINKFVIGNI